MLIRRLGVLVLLATACPATPTESPDDGNTVLTSFFVEFPELAALYAARDPVLQGETWWVGDSISHCSLIVLPLENLQWRPHARKAANRWHNERVDAAFAAQVRQLDDVVQPLGYEEFPHGGDEKYTGLRTKGESGMTFYRKWGPFPLVRRPTSRREFERLWAKKQRVFELNACAPREGDAEHLPAAMMDLLRSLPDLALGLRFVQENKVPIEYLDVWWGPTFGLSVDLAGCSPSATGHVLRDWISNEPLWDYESEGTGGVFVQRGWFSFEPLCDHESGGTDFIWKGWREGKFYSVWLVDYLDGSTDWNIRVESPAASSPWQ